MDKHGLRGLLDEEELPEEDSQEEGEEKDAAKSPFFRANHDQLMEWWHEHKSTPKDDFRARNKIINAAQPIIDAAVRPYAKSGTSKSLLQDPIVNALITGIEKYDPNHESGAALESYLFRKIFPKGNLGVSVANTAVRKGKSPVEAKSRDYAVLEKFRQTAIAFKEKHGRTPSIAEMADLMKVSVRKAADLKRQSASIYMTSNIFDDSGSHNPLEDPRYKNAVRTVYYTLTGIEKAIMEKLYWEQLGLPKPMSEVQSSWTSELNVNGTKITRTKQKIAKLIEQHM